MDTGIQKAKGDLSKLVEAAALEGQGVFPANVQLVATPPPSSSPRGRGFLKHGIHLYPGWDSLSEDKRIEEDFEALDRDPNLRDEN